ncbi:MAG: Rieske 2Fe-2S domain-containing protein [Alphaproteobacteria bacterium]
MLPDEKTIAEYRARCFTGRPGLRCTLEELVAHLEEKNRRIAGFRANLAGEAPIVFSAFGANIAVTLGERVEKIDALPERYLLLDAPEWWLAAMVGGWSGQDLCLTMAPRLARVGHDYSTAQNIFLFSNLGDVATNFRQTFTIRQERIRKEEGGVVYEIDRYCPHQGGDLLHCELKRGRIRCARHSIVFDLAQGGAAVNAEGLSINAVVVEKVAVPAE